MKVKSYITEIEEALKPTALVDKDKAQKLKKYIGTQLIVLGNLAKEQSKIHKIGFSFSSENSGTIYQLYSEIYKLSNVFEVKNQAFLFLDKHFSTFSPEVHLNILPDWIKHVDNWAHSDSLSKFLTRLVENNHTKNKMINILNTWNASENEWERRQSLILLYYYARTKTEHIEFDLGRRLITTLLKDNSYYVQKAVGWSLRESYNVYPSETYELIQQHIHTISATAFTTCTEKMSSSQKELLKQLRKNRKSLQYNR